MPLTPFHEVRFPTDLSLGSRFGPGFSTEVVALGDGSEQRNSKWSQARHQGDVHYSVKTVAQLQALLTFFHARHGRAQGFRFKWHLDYQALGDAFAVGNGSRTVYPLVREHRSGGSLYQHRVYKPVGLGYPIGNSYDSVTLYANETLMTSGYALDYTTGLVTFAPAPASGVVIKWVGEFDWPVRFDVDTLAESLQAIRSYMTAASGELVSGTPEYFLLLDGAGTPWYFWFDSLGQLTRDVSPPVGGWVFLTTAPVPSWHQVTDETSTPWWLFPDSLGQLQSSTGPPGGTGLTFNTQAQDGIRAIGESGTARYRLTSDTNGQPTVLPSLFVPGQLVFDGIGLAEPIPIIEVR